MRAAGEDDATCAFQFGYRYGGQGNFGIEPQKAESFCYQVGILAPEVQHYNFVLRHEGSIPKNPRRVTGAVPYSTVTLFARLRGLSGSLPRCTAQ